MTLLISSLIGFALAYAWEYFCENILKKTALIIKGRRLHHSLYGLVFMFLGLSVQSVFLLGLGLGILIQHTLTDGFIFISKEK